MRLYVDILRSRYVGALVASSLLARLPVGINALAIVLYLREQTGSFAIAGAVSGTLAAGSGIGAPVQGRLVDRIGARRVLVPLACVHALGLGAIVAFAELGEPTVLLLVCGFVSGFAVPPTSSVLRSLWPDLLEPRLHRTAYALDSTLIEVIFISGPLLTAIIAALTSPAGALIVSAVAVVAGTTIFTALPPTQHVEPEDRAPGGLLGALASPGVRALVLMSLPTGVGIGMLEVGIPAFSRAEGAAAAAGALLALWSFGSLVGGLLYGTLPRRRGLFQTHLIVGSLLPLTLLPLAVAPSVWAMALLVLPAGCCIAPLLATRNELVAGVAPPGMRIESYTWPITAFVGGIAIGAALCGTLVEGPGWRTAFVVAAIFAAGGAVLAALWRKTIQPRVPATP